MVSQYMLPNKQKANQWHDFSKAFSKAFNNKNVQKTQRLKNALTGLLSYSHGTCHKCRPCLGYGQLQLLRSIVVRHPVIDLLLPGREYDSKPCSVKGNSDGILNRNTQ